MKIKFDKKEGEITEITSQEYYKIVAELGLIIGVNYFLNPEPNSRLGGLLRKLSKACEKELAYVEKIQPLELKMINEFILNFMEKIGWIGGKTKHIGSYINLCLLFVDGKPEYKKINDILLSIMTFFERGKIGVHYGTAISASNAHEKWIECLKNRGWHEC